MLEIFHKPYCIHETNFHIKFIPEPVFFTVSGIFFTGSSIILMLVYKTIFPIGIYKNY